MNSNDGIVASPFSMSMKISMFDADFTLDQSLEGINLRIGGRDNLQDPPTNCATDDKKTVVSCNCSFNASFLLGDETTVGMDDS